MFRSALLSVMKMLKLLLLSSAYAIILEVVQDIKRGRVTEERHHNAQQLQRTLEHDLLTTEQKLKYASAQLAKQHFEKVCYFVCQRIMIVSWLYLWEMLPFDLVKAIYMYI